MSSNRKVLDNISAFLILQRLRKENVLNSSTYRVTFTDCWASLHEGCLRTEKEQQLGTLPTAH
ncbi:hypothetical protein T08_13928 [Trichinella sp. T8]|nr:hypothetical protein T08_13928 [Trichinella sp. T8]